MTANLFTASILLETGIGKTEVVYLSELSLPEWHNLIAEAAVESNGNAAFYPEEWRKRNANGFDVGSACFAHCGVASWLYATVLALAEKNCKIKYYVDLEHVTVLVDGKETDVTQPQHAKEFDGSKSKEIIVIPLSDFEAFTKNDAHRTRRRFELFAAAMARVLRKRKLA